MESPPCFRHLSYHPSLGATAPAISALGISTLALCFSAASMARCWFSAWTRGTPWIDEELPLKPSNFLWNIFHTYSLKNPSYSPYDYVVIPYNIVIPLIVIPHIYNYLYISGIFLVFHTNVFPTISDSLQSSMGFPPDHLLAEVQLLDRHLAMRSFTRGVGPGGGQIQWKKFGSLMMFDGIYQRHGKIGI